MVFSKIRCKKWNGNHRTFREINASNEHERTIGTDKKAEESPLFHNDNITVHVYAAQWIKHYCILHGDYCEKGNGHVDHTFDCGDHHQCNQYVCFDFDINTTYLIEY